MVNKELLIKEIESLPSELLTEAFDFIRFIKVSHAKAQCYISTIVVSELMKVSTVRSRSKRI